MLIKYRKRIPCVFGVFKSTKGFVKYCLKKHDFEEKWCVMSTCWGYTCSYSIKHQSRYCSEGILQTWLRFIISKGGYPRLCGWTWFSQLEVFKSKTEKQFHLWAEASSFWRILAWPSWWPTLWFWTLLASPHNCKRPLLATNLLIYNF